MRHFLSQFHLVPPAPDAVAANDDEDRSGEDCDLSTAERDALCLTGRSAEDPERDRDIEARFATMLTSPWF